VKSEELRHARAGFYIVDEGFDLVVNGDSPCRDPDDAIREARRLHERTGRVYLVRQVLNVIDPRPPCVECGRQLDCAPQDPSSLCIRCQISRRL